MSLHAAHCVNLTPSNQLAFSSWDRDEQARKQTEFTISRSARFRNNEVKNGNMTPLIVQSEKSHGASPLPSNFQVNTSTRTQFHDAFYESHMTIHDNVTSPKFKSSVMKSTGHKSMDMMAATDPRQHTVKSAASPNVGPGYYETDPMHIYTTGMAVCHSDSSHQMLAYAKDPTRRSPSFLSQSRESTDSRTAPGMETAAIPFLPPDYGSWMQPGFASPKEPRVIKSERWGINSREQRPPAIDLLFDPQMTVDGRPSTCAAYSQASTSPSYKRAFHSGLPRLMALPGGHSSDTRISAKNHERLSGTPPCAGPGSYSLEPARLKSFHAAFAQAHPYHSLASDVPPLSGRCKGNTAPAPLSQHVASMPSTPAQREQQNLGFSPSTSLPGSPGRASTASHTARSSQALRAPPAADVRETQMDGDADWEVHQALMRHHFHGDGDRLPAHESSREVQRSPHTTTGAIVGPRGVEAFLAEDPSTSNETGAQPLPNETEAILSAARAAALLERAHSAPTTQMSSQRRRAGSFGKLVFLRRAVPYNSLVQAHLSAAADVRRTRKQITHNS